MSADLSTRYLGLELRNPIVPSASTLSSRIDNLKRLQDAGAAAVVMQSLFEEQIEREELEINRVLEAGVESFPEALTFFPELEDYNTGPNAYLRHLEQSKKELEIPVIGSLNGVSAGGWVQYAKLIQDAGADALELNVYFLATDPAISGEPLPCTWQGSGAMRPRALARQGRLDGGEHVGRPGVVGALRMHAQVRLGSDRMEG